MSKLLGIEVTVSKNWKGRKVDLSVLGVKLLGNVGLLVHGDRTTKLADAREEETKEKKAAPMTKVKLVFSGHTVSPQSRSLSSLNIIPPEKRRDEGERSQPSRSWLLALFLPFYYCFFLSFFALCLSLPFVSKVVCHII